MVGRSRGSALDLRLRNKAALVTGGGRGTGREIALTLAREGVNVAICGRTRDVLERSAAEIAAVGVKSAAIVMDLLDPADCVRAVEETVAAFGRLDILISNASTNVEAHPPDIDHLSDEQLMERVMGKGVAAVRMSRAALKHIRHAGGGSIVCIGGTSVRHVPGPGDIAGGLGNTFVAHFAKRLSAEVAKDRITVNVIHPGETKTERYPARIEALAAKLEVPYAEAEARKVATIPIGRMVEPGDVASLVAFLVSPLASAITGQSIAVDGGFVPVVVY